MSTAEHVREIETAWRGGISGWDSYVIQSWRRCLDEYHLDPAVNCEAVILPEGRLKEHRQQAEELVGIARSGARAGNSVLVTGAGPIGLLTLLAARAAGAGPLFLSDLNDSRLAFAKAAVPDLITLNPKRDNIGEAVRAATEGGVGCDVALECVGNEHALKACLDAVRKQGVVVQTGLHLHENPLDWFQVTFKDVDLRGAWAYPTHYWPRVIRLIASGALPASKAVTARIKLQDAVAQGFDALLDPSGKHLKILIDLNG